MLSIEWTHRPRLDGLLTAQGEDFDAIAAHARRWVCDPSGFTTSRLCLLAPLGVLDHAARLVQPPVARAPGGEQLPLGAVGGVETERSDGPGPRPRVLGALHDPLEQVGRNDRASHDPTVPRAAPSGQGNRRVSTGAVPKRIRNIG